MTATSMLWRRVDTRGSLHMPPHDMLNGRGWEMVVGSVSPPLRRAIAGYAGFYEEFAAPIRRLETSSAFAKLILCFEGSVNAARPGKRSTVKLTAFAVGLGHAAMVARHDGRLGCLEVELSPGTAKTLLDDSPTLAGAGIVDLQDLWGAEASTLISRLCDAPDWTARFAVIDETLLARSAVTNVAIPADVQWAWNQIASSQGRVNISQLARDIGWSGRHFAARFVDAIGMAPKAAARVLRFDRARGLVASPANYQLSGIALDCGYSDQSHMTREFREFADCSPARYERPA